MVGLGVINMKSVVWVRAAQGNNGRMWVSEERSRRREERGERGGEMVEKEDKIRRK